MSEERPTKVYEGAAIRVVWHARRCIHSAACIRALPRVFDPRRRPWIDVGAADADAVADAVSRCPTGALHYERLDGGDADRVEPGARISAARDGPLIVRGEVELVDEDGTVIRRDTRIALCRCGQSKRLPFCDDTHRAVGFRSANPAPAAPPAP